MLNKLENLTTVKRSVKSKTKKPKVKLKNITKAPYKKGGGSMKKDFINAYTY